MRLESTCTSRLKDQIGRERDRLELLIRQIKEVEEERDALLAAQAKPSAVALQLKNKGLGAEFATVLGRIVPAL